MEDDGLQDVRDDGAAAFAEQFASDWNPYPEGDAKYDAWNAGYERARQEEERKSYQE